MYRNTKNVGDCIDNKTVLRKKNFPLPSDISPELYVFNIAESESEARKFLSHTIFERNEVIKFNITVQYLILFTLIYKNSLLIGQKVYKQNIYIVQIDRIIRKNTHIIN
jgi:hypothetical protein